MEPNVSEETRDCARMIFRLLAFLAEVCIFLELGLSGCGMHKAHFSWPFVSWAFVAALLGRAIGVYPLSFLYNLSLMRAINTTLKAVSVEMISTCRCTTEDRTTSTVEYKRSDTDDLKNKYPKKDMVIDIETLTRSNCTKEEHIIFDDDGIKKEGIRNRDIPMSSATTPSSPGKINGTIVGDDSTASSNTSMADTSVMSTSFYELMPTVVSKRETPERKRDKIIPVKFMHLLWFAGLRGAVAYACAREFPDAYGHRDEFIAATMVIVVVTIVLMGGATEPLMDRLGIQMNVDNDKYMKSWHQQRKLEGRLLHFEYHWIYRFVVRDQSIQLMDESCGYIEQVDDGLEKDYITSKLVPGRNLGATFTTIHRQAEHQHLNNEGNGLDCSILTEDSSSKNRSLIDEQYEEEPDGIIFDGYSKIDNDSNRSSRRGEATIGTNGRSTPVQSNMTMTTPAADA